MSKRRKRSTTGTMLELWRPPRGAGEAVGCIATTYTFEPSLFDEQCLARFLEVESEPNREDLAFLLEREARLGAAYAAVLVDHTQAGVDHSLRWDVLPIRIWGGKQHAKLTLLVWTNHVRIIVASANLTEPGYRSNREVAIALDLTPDEVMVTEVEAAVDFLRCLLAFVPGAGPSVPEIQRSLGFLERVERQVAEWNPTRRSKVFRRQLVFTLPQRDDNPATGGAGFNARSSLDEAIAHCRSHGGSPTDAWIASPFFDAESSKDAATTALCKAMARGVTRRLDFCVPMLGNPDERPQRLAAPRSLRATPQKYSAIVDFELLPQCDGDGNLRPWHAKMLALQSKTYSALLAGSSNFTRAGLGIGARRNAEVNLLTIAQRRPHAREPGELEAVWPEMEQLDDPDAAEWLGPKTDLDEEQLANAVPLPSGFLAATYRAGDARQIVLRFDAANLPETWSVHTCGRDAGPLLDSEDWTVRGRAEIDVVSWKPVQPPERLLVQWSAGEAFWPLNVEDARQLPPPAELAEMSADDMLMILAASDPSAAYRAWTKRRQRDEGFDDELDTAIPTDLDPLRRYDLRSTFLRRIRIRARVLAQLRQNLQRPVWSAQALQWRLEGFIGIKPLAERLVQEVVEADGQVDEAILTLADFLIVLREVDYEPVEGALPKAQFDGVYRPFLHDLVSELHEKVLPCRRRIGKELVSFWERVVERCRK